jgi:signal transduction histidine kinase
MPSATAPAGESPDRSAAAIAAATAAAAVLPQPLRSERLVGRVRVGFAAAALFALWLDPSEPSRLAGPAYALLGGYAALALATAVWLARRRSLPRRLPLLLHVIDVGVFALLAAVAAGVTSPFLVVFVFLLATAALRWRQHGAVLTALAAIGLYFAIGMLAALSAPGSIDAVDLLVRCVQLAVVGGLLVGLGAGERRLRRRSAVLSGWPALAPAGSHQQVPELLGYVARALHAQRLLLVWEEVDEPLLNVALWFDSRCGWSHEDPELLAPLAPPGLETVAFITSGGERGGGFDPARRVAVVADGELPGWLRSRFAPANVLSVPMQGDSLAGRLYAFEVEDLTEDELVFAGLLAQRIALRLDHLEMFARVHREGLAGERTRLARDLHDGVIQSLAAAALRLEAAKQMLVDEPLAASQLIEDIQDLLLSEQRELRGFLGGIEARPTAAAVIERPPPALEERLQALAERTQRHWNLKVDLVSRLPTGELGRGLEHHLQCIVLEALVNASRHGRATQARVDLALLDRQLRIAVADNGGGFPFQGRRAFEELQASSDGPASIRNRVATLGGRLDIDSGSGGATLSIVLPCQPEERAA